MIIGVTGCLVGIVYIYFVVEVLEKGVVVLGFEIKVEINGLIGVKNSLSVEEIECVEVIVVVCDK